MSFRRVVKKLMPTGLFAAIEPYGHLAEAVVFNVLNGFPARGMNVIGITGTNGKTTTAFMVHKMLHEAGYKTALISTVGWGIGDDIKSQRQHYTSVPVPELMRRLKYLRKQNIDWLVLETTSHALAQHRVFGVPYSIAVLTNLTHEHLSYHRTFERYRDAKRRLFKLTDRNRRGLQTGIVNAEDPSAELFMSDIKYPVTYGINKGEIKAINVKLSPSGSTYRVKVADGEYNITCRLPGSFNVYNSLAVLCVGRAAGLTSEQIEQGIAALEQVEGRMVRVDEGQDFDVIVDYAHTPDSFEKLFKDMKPLVKGKLIVLFGSLGGGDKGKRPEQGRLAGEYADEVIVCEEDDRQEDPEAIMEDVARGVEAAGKVREKDLFMIHDRPQAIEFAFKRAKKGDTVMLLGKGHEKTIERANGEHPWDEVATARKTLKSLKIN